VRGHSRLRIAPRTARERLVATVDRLPARERVRLAATLERLVDGMGLARQRPAAMFDETATRKHKAGRSDA